MSYPNPWRCWRCGGSHSYVLARCPDAGVNEGAPTRAQMQARLDAWLSTLGLS
jgi:hypothetical protein